MYCFIIKNASLLFHVKVYFFCYIIDCCLIIKTLKTSFISSRQCILHRQSLFYIIHKVLQKTVKTRQNKVYHNVAPLPPINNTELLTIHPLLIPPPRVNSWMYNCTASGLKFRISAIGIPDTAAAWWHGRWSPKPNSCSREG